MKFTKDNIALVDGDIFLHDDSVNIENKETYIYINQIRRNVVATTNTSIPGVPHIDRKHFQKPDFDVWDKAWEYSTYENAAAAFFDGYQANKKEFTMEELKQAWTTGVIGGKSFEDLISVLRPLSIPSLITCDDDFENLRVTW